MEKLKFLKELIAIKKAMSKIGDYSYSRKNRIVNDGDICNAVNTNAKLNRNDADTECR